MFLILFLSMDVFAQTVGEVPSCYVLNGINFPHPNDREVFILIDQTTLLDEDLKKSVFMNIGKLISPGNSIVLAVFSSYSQGHYLNILNEGIIEKPLPEKARDNIPVTKLSSFDKCLENQKKGYRQLFANSLQTAFSKSSSDLARSDILQALKQISSRIEESKRAPQKIIFIVSDMLENSSISSFYFNKNVREIDPSVEIKLVEKNNLISNFDGAKVFVLGAGLLQDSSSGTAKPSELYRDPKVINSLKTFWEEYFKKSNAIIRDFGMPALTKPVE